MNSIRRSRRFHVSVKMIFSARDESRLSLISLRHKTSELVLICSLQKSRNWQPHDTNFSSRVSSFFSLHLRSIETCKTFVFHKRRTIKNLQVLKQEKRVHMSWLKLNIMVGTFFAPTQESFVMGRWLEWLSERSVFADKLFLGSRIRVFSLFFTRSTVTWDRLEVFGHLNP